jgi:hypothetical protein
MRSRKARKTGASAVEQPGSPTSADFALVGVEVFTIALPAQSVAEIECLWTDRKHAVCNWLNPGASAEEGLNAASFPGYSFHRRTL